LGIDGDLIVSHGFFFDNIDENQNPANLPAAFHLHRKIKSFEIGFSFKYCFEANFAYLRI